MGLLLLMGDSERKLLDQYTAAVAYSLRKLRTAYSGSAIRVRRSSDSAEQDIGFSGNNLDTASMLSFCGAGNGFVTTWYDQVGSNNAVQTTAGNQPQIVASGATIVNEFSKPAIRFTDASAAAIGWRLIFDPFYVASQAYVGHFSVYSLELAGNFPPVINSDPSDRGFSTTHNGATRQPRTYSVRTTTPFGDATAISLNTTTIRHDSTDRSRVRTYLGTSASTAIDVGDSNTDFSMPTKLLIGNQNTATPVCQTIVSEFIGFTTSQASSELLIRTNQSNYWRA
jgi:hypothetical protein